MAVAQQLVAAGMGIARIICAHACVQDWAAMAENVRSADADAGRSVRILMDLGGPKIRTGELTRRPAVLRMRPQRDEYGRPYDSYRVGIKPKTQTVAKPDVDGCLGVDGTSLAAVSSPTSLRNTRNALNHPWRTGQEVGVMIARGDLAVECG